jgi:hypothetical protein
VTPDPVPPSAPPKLTSEPWLRKRTAILCSLLSLVILAWLLLPWLGRGESNEEFDRESVFGSSPVRSGWCAAWAGDVNGDGTPDILLSTPYELPGDGGRSGVVRVLSGVDGSALRTIRAFHTDTQWGVIPVGDFDLDGCADFVVDSRSENRVSVISGRDGHILLSLREEGWWLSSVSAMGDVDRDGHPELLLGSDSADAGGKYRGMVRVVSGETGSELHAVRGEFDEEGFGWKARDVGDLDGDGTNDFAVASCPPLWRKEPPPKGVVQIYSGRSGNLIRTIEDPSFTQRDQFWPAVDFLSVDDIDGDRVLDMVVWSPKEHDTTVLFVSGKDGSIIRRRDDRTCVLGITSVGDVDGDRAPDLGLVDYSGWVIDSGVGSRRLFTFPGESVGVGIGDLDHDGRADLLVLSNVVIGNDPSRSEEWKNAWRMGRLDVVSGRDGSVLLHIDGSNLDLHR